MSQMNEEAAAGEGGSNTVGSDKVDMNPTGVKIGDDVKRRMADEMAKRVKESASRVYAATTKKK